METSPNVTMNSNKFNRVEYNKAYYEKNKQKILVDRSDKYQQTKLYKDFLKYVDEYLDEDLIIIRDVLLSLDENNIHERDKVILLMKYAKILMEIKALKLGFNDQEIQEIRNLSVEC